MAKVENDDPEGWQGPKSLKRTREAHRRKSTGAPGWLSQLVKRPTCAQVMISRFMSSSPALGCVLTAQSLEPVSDSVSPSLSAPSPLTLCLSQK